MRRQHRRYGGTGKTLVIIAILALIALFAGLLYYSHVQDEKQAEELRAIAEQQREERRAEEEAKQQEAEELRLKEENDSFYQKLADGFDVSILIVGDSIGAGTGASAEEYRWANVLASSLQEKYGVKVTTTNVSMGGNASYAGYVRTAALNDGVDYDAVILCYGQNDSRINFEIYYEALIRIVKDKYPTSSIFSILESSQKDYTEKMGIIQELANYYGIPVADTIAPFQADYDSLVKDSVHPNDDGQAVYAETVEAMIDKNVASYCGRDEAKEATKGYVDAFGNYKWIPADQFERVGNTYIFTGEMSGVVMGTDYTFVSGENNCEIYLDDMKYAAPEVSFNYDFSQRHIMIVNSWVDDEGKVTGENVKAEKAITVKFPDDGNDQADGFKGIMISW